MRKYRVCHIGLKCNLRETYPTNTGRSQIICPMNSSLFTDPGTTRIWTETVQCSGKYHSISEVFMLHLLNLTNLSLVHCKIKGSVKTRTFSIIYRIVSCTGTVSAQLLSSCCLCTPGKVSGRSILFSSGTEIVPVCPLSNDWLGVGGPPRLLPPFLSWLLHWHTILFNPEFGNNDTSHLAKYLKVIWISNLLNLYIDKSHHDNIILDKPVKYL